MAKKLAFKDPPSLKFHDRSDIRLCIFIEGHGIWDWKTFQSCLPFRSPPDSSNKQGPPGSFDQGWYAARGAHVESCRHFLFLYLFVSERLFTKWSTIPKKSQNRKWTTLGRAWILDFLKKATFLLKTANLELHLFYICNKIRS